MDVDGQGRRGFLKNRPSRPTARDSFGRDPRRILVEQLLKVGLSADASMSEVIRAKYLDCCGEQRDEVRNCVADGVVRGLDAHDGQSSRVAKLGCGIVAGVPPPGATVEGGRAGDVLKAAHAIPGSGVATSRPRPLLAPYTTPAW